MTFVVKQKIDTVFPGKAKLLYDGVLQLNLVFEACQADNISDTNLITAVLDLVRFVKWKKIIPMQKSYYLHSLISCFPSTQLQSYVIAPAIECAYFVICCNGRQWSS
jgi:hypothetical protein